MTTPELPLTLNATLAAVYLGVSRSRIYELDASGHLPSPVDWEPKKRWARYELKRWAKAGFPPRHEWEQMK